MTGVLWAIPRCTCGHHMDAHHRTPKGRYTWCGVWDDNRECPCTEYTPQKDTPDD